ncbi:Oxidoreductase FAD-binding domain protein [Shewanella halifaxensis HAW-EB4]|uniref:Oxidoreductase FAD-binding domain protein n=1 Tax=Shewanella halifaxensis (strain HAW-EB4) TaxID=458817 RepID=B0TTU3_SHEHH|nr:ferredoxin--NADP reductase [Shewanella halifaxensis]ABZ76661.1 Oxidoreductase FAD-binding domain protein [Shewanella halifaxensis HAW-EB4]
MSSSRYHHLTVSHIIEETEDSRSLVFDLPESLRQKFAYKAGQFLTFRIPKNGEYLLRCYSLSNTPKDSSLKVTIKRVPNGLVSSWVMDEVKVGDKIEVMQPAGIFVPKSVKGDMLLCAGGSGITPVFSILQTALAQGEGNIRLIYANRDEKSVIFKEQLKALTCEYPNRLEVIHLIDSVSGIPNPYLLARLAQPFSGLLNFAGAFICGPGPFMDSMEKALESIDMSADKIYIERFISLPNEKIVKTDELIDEQSIAATEDEHLSPELDQRIDARAIIELDGQSHSVNWSKTDTLLEAAEKAGLSLPHSCREGMCASCMCEVKEGNVKLRINDVLSERDLKQSLTLSCQAVPLSEHIRICYT